jgi:hypothetical protein
MLYGATEVLGRYALPSSAPDRRAAGSPEQVRLAQEFAMALARDKTAELDPLLLSLQTVLRS